MKVLVINTYGGSLLLGAKALGCEIIGSYEDVGFGQPIQQANFPGLDFREFRKDWPKQDLSETFVIAHPPCSAFSVQNTSKDKRGVDSAAFACTKSVLQYAMENKAVGIAIESVVGALAGAWAIHQTYADGYGYNLYRVMQNGCMFSAQWRDRFWVIYIKKGAVPNDTLSLTLQPNWQNVRQVVDGYNDGPSPLGLDELLERLKQRFVDEAKCTPSEMEQIFGPNPTGLDGMCSVDDRLWRLKFPSQDRWEVCKQYVTKYASGAMVLLSPDGLAPVLLGGSWWYLDGRNVSETAYKRLMGFPADYIFPEGDSRKTNFKADMRTYLSKGVIPAVATWILHQSLTHLGASVPEIMRADGPQPYHLEVKPNDIADFRIRKKTWGQAHPELRHEDDRPKPTTKTTVVITPTVQGAETPTPEAAPKRGRGRPRKDGLPPIMRIPRRRSPWNAPEIEETLQETLFVRPNTADSYALHESHGYHRMGVREGDIVLDMGAHIGCVASRAALVGAKQVISIEPEPENYALLQQNTRTFKNVETINAAVTAGSGPTATLHVVKRNSEGGHSTGTHSCTFTTRGNALEVPRLDFRELLLKYEPTVVKCDIEGGELDLDWTNLPPSVRSIGIELHTKGGKYRSQAIKIVDELTTQGFKPVNNLNMQSNFSAIIAYFSREQEANV